MTNEAAVNIIDHYLGKTNFNEFRGHPQGTLFISGACFEHGSNNLMLHIRKTSAAEFLLQLYDLIVFTESDGIVYEFEWEMADDPQIIGESK